MRLIVADAAGSGQLIDKDGMAHDLSADAWAECDVRDSIVVGAGQHAQVRYREDGRVVEVPAGTTYGIEYVSENVIDIRWAGAAADELIAAMDGVGTDEDKIYEVLGRVHGDAEKVQQLKDAFHVRTDVDLEVALQDELSGDELTRALNLLR